MLYFYFNFPVLLLLGNLSFLFLLCSISCLLPYHVTESLCQVFHGTISINCGHFYSVGWHCLTLLTANCSACNAVWGPPAWNRWTHGECECAGWMVLSFQKWEIKRSTFDLILTSYTFCQIQWISPYGLLAVILCVRWNIIRCCFTALVP